MGFISSDGGICSTMAFPPLGSDVIISVSIDFLSNSKENGTFHCTAYDYSHTDWDGLCDHFRDAQWEGIFKFGFKMKLTLYIPHHKYRVKPNLSPWSLDAYAAAIAHRNHFFFVPTTNLLNLK